MFGICLVYNSHKAYNVFTFNLCHWSFFCVWPVQASLNSSFGALKKMPGPSSGRMDAGLMQSSSFYGIQPDSCLRLEKKGRPSCSRDTIDGWDIPTHKFPSTPDHWPAPMKTSIWKFGLEGPWFELHFPSAAGCCMHSSACIVHLHVPTSKYKNRALHHHLLMWQQVLLVHTFVIIHYIFTQMITRMYAYCCLTTSFGYAKLQNTDIPFYFAPEIRII